MTVYFDKAKNRMTEEQPNIVMSQVLQRFIGYLNYIEERVADSDEERYLEFKLAALGDIQAMKPISSYDKTIDQIHELSHMLVKGNFMVRPGLEGPTDSLKFPGNWD